MSGAPAAGEHQGHDPELIVRVEEAGINASAPRQQRWLDGWLVRSCPGLAKRARCIQAVAAGRLPLDAKLARCRAVYSAAGLPMVVRITPFSEPAGLDDYLDAAGMSRVDESRVMIMSLTAEDIGATPAQDTRQRLPPGFALEAIDADAFAAWIGRARGSTEAEIRAHAQRLGQSPVPYHAFIVKTSDGECVAGGQVAREDDLVGLYDVLTAPAQRGLGIGRALCRHLLAQPRSEGARFAYLQVDVRNETARRLYSELGFVDAYTYHYRMAVQGRRA